MLTTSPNALAITDHAHFGVLRWLENVNGVTIERLRKINSAADSPMHIVLTLTFGVYDKHINRINRTIASLMLSRMTAQRKGQLDRVRRINSVLEQIHDIVDRKTICAGMLAQVPKLVSLPVGINYEKMTSSSPRNNTLMNDPSSSQKSTRQRGPLHWEQSYKLLGLIQNNPNISAEHLVQAGTSIGITISLRTAFRFLQRFRSNKGDLFRCTNTHLKVIAEILQEAKAGNHLTALDLQQLALKRGETLHLTTVYRILHRLVSSGAVLELQKGRNTLYEWKRSNEHHGHLSCVKCGRTIEFDHDYLDDMAQKICQSLHYEYLKFEFNLLAYCTRCRNN